MQICFCDEFLDAAHNYVSFNWGKGKSSTWCCNLIRYDEMKDKVNLKLRHRWGFFIELAGANTHLSRPIPFLLFTNLPSFGQQGASLIASRWVLQQTRGPEC